MTRMTRLAILPAALLLGACAQEPDFGEQLRAEGGRVASIGESWTKGNEMVERGRDLVDEGEDLVSEGRGKVRRGEDLIRRGEAMREDAREAYQQTARTSAEG